MGLGIKGVGRKKDFKHHNAIWAVFIFIIISVTSGAYVSPAIAQDYTFSRIVVQGNTRVGDAAVVTRAGIGQGETVTAGQVNDALQNLQNSGLFETVSVVPQGSTLLISVVERATLNRVVFEGNKRLKDDELREVVESKERRAFSASQAESDASAIAEAYSVQGRIAARVTPRIIRRSDNRVDLIFEIFEGDVVEIERLSFLGNRVFSDRRLRRVLQTKQAGIFRALIKSDTLIAERVDFDKQLLQDFYFSRGYVDFRIVSTNAQLTKERDGFFLVFKVQEGQQFNFGNISVVSDIPGLDLGVYRKSIKIKPGVVYSPTLVENEISRLEKQGQSDGVDFLRVEPRITRNDRDLSLNVQFVLSRGPRVFVERIDIEGNTTTLDRVIRQQFKIAEGDPFNPREIRDAAERIRALNFFENTDVNAREGSSPDQVIVDVDVEEAPTGSLNFGGSYGVNDGFGLAIGFTERNFLGRGQTVSLSLSTAQDAAQYGVSFLEPAFLGRDVAFGFTLQYNESDSSFSNFDGESLLFSPSLSFPVSEKGRVKLVYSLRRNEMQGRSPPDNGAVVQNEIDAGREIVSSLGYAYSYDTRKTGLDPTAGVYFEFGQDFAGLGGDAEFIRSKTKIVGERRILSEEVTLRATFEGGLLNWRGGTNRSINRFQVGPRIFRGFEPFGIGPRDFSAPDDADPLGGNMYWVARLETEFPIGLPDEWGIGAAIFYDAGNVWDLDDVDLAGGDIKGQSGSIRHVVGASILWDSVIGPLRFNFTKALKKESYDEEQSFDFAIQSNF
ncbi:MAG: outer membrane protein assembly factor BamA [Tateyamaria sp.]|jgi:outer membrane protein insertion porin family|nr:outer membrane protein assembly factor BamA [Tateyamaria sp.]MCH9746873.1 outer membrane protein assembly factor BamA [Alphaproteobacteria bacterium]HAB40161.1 outer membrane protein assembly factor BamA [Paracoccaceae bacterium]MBT6266870.1 outer membrane protein assembly factor BamA [Tateyamaria sp.]MBT6343715.1 outer membrane protein assembly factor BamA [Tateyamaria sp.]